MPHAVEQPSGAQSSRLQFYLVITLVAITIIILALLLLMLLARRRWIDNSSQLVTTEYPDSPQQDIAPDKGKPSL